MLLLLPLQYPSCLPASPVTALARVPTPAGDNNISTIAARATLLRHGTELKRPCKMVVLL